MPSKQFMLDSGLPVHIYKRKSNRHLRLSITPAGAVRVTIPAWAPYSAGVDFAKSRQQWIADQRPLQQALVEGQSVGKAHHLYFKAATTSTKVTTRLVEGAIIITHPPGLHFTDPVVQAAAQKASIRALRLQAQRLLCQRVAALADVHNFSYTSISIKQLKSRWGSCDHHKNIVLNLFLMQLPWEYIDYVILHELTHTRILKHGPEFWQAMATLLPDVSRIRKKLHNFQPVLEVPSGIQALGE